MASNETLEYLQRIAAQEKQIERATSRAIIAERRVAELEAALEAAKKTDKAA